MTNARLNPDRRNGEALASPPKSRSARRSRFTQADPPPERVDGPDQQIRAATPRSWDEQLIRSTYGRLARPRRPAEFSVRLEHERRTLTFPLGTGDPRRAALRAGALAREVEAEGWDCVLGRHPREITLAVFWGENPLVCTYTTLYSIPGSPRHSSAIAASAPPATTTVAFVEGDAACRRALVDWTRGLAGFACAGAYATGDDARCGLRRRPASLVLFNRKLPGLGCGEWLKALPGESGRGIAFAYQIYDSSDELFVSQPGTSGGYYFRRRAPDRLLEPLQGLPRNGSGSKWQSCGQAYVQRLLELEADADPKLGSDPSSLTPRERDILGCLCRGYSDKGIAQALHITTWTVHTHLKRIYQKLDAESRTEAVIKYLQK